MSKLIDFSALNEMLFGETKYIKEFAAAAIDSFSEFGNHYSAYLPVRDETSLRKAGHKIKPVAQMLGLHQVVDEYERAKKLLTENAPNEELEQSVTIIQDIISEVLVELNEIMEQE